MVRDFDWEKALSGELGKDVKENTEHCKHIADALMDVAEGLVYRDGDGEEHVPQMELETDEDIPEDWEQMSIYDWFDDIYDIRYVVNSDMEVVGCRVMVAFGGPNIYVDTYEEAVCLYWWSSYAHYPLSGQAKEAVNGWAQELFDMKRRE